MDPLTIATIANAGVQAYSAFSASKGQADANKQGMAFNASEAQKQRDYEERLFSTRYQTTRKDLEAAGYNPIMALGLNPGVPSGAAAHADPKSTTAESSQILSKSAREIADVALTRQVGAKTAFETESAKAHATVAKQDADAYSSMPWLAKIKAVLNSLPGLGGIMGGVGVGALMRGAQSAKGAHVVSRQGYRVSKGGFLAPGLAKIVHAAQSDRERSWT